MGELAGFKFAVESYSGRTSGVLIIGIGSYYIQQEILMRERAVGVAGILQWHQISTEPK